MPTKESLVENRPDITASDRDQIFRAFDFAQKAHENHLRHSGEPYFSHLAATAQILSDIQTDPTTIIAGLLHDTLEDTAVSADEIKNEFGDEVLHLVQGVTKLGHLKYQGMERHAESLRKFFIASAHDIRVVVIKLADRLHNISTLKHIPADKQHRIALETLEIHARLADRLGMGKMKAQLEDLAFPFAFPQEYAKTKDILDQAIQLGEQHLEQAANNLREELSILEANVTSLNYRVKHLYSIWKKLVHYHYDISKIYDIFALRIIVPNVGDCYQALGIIHGLYKPVPGKFKDYIALPKPNGYQSLHTTVFDGHGGVIEIQIRTEIMHQEAQYGIYSHTAYKENNKNPKKSPTTENWIQKLLEVGTSTEKTEEFLNHLRRDFFEGHVFVYTPKGDIVELPDGACVIDFAYAIHSDIGNRMTGGRINHKMVSIDTKLQQGDVVEIVCSERSKPTRKWIDLCKTNFAKQHIRRYLREHGGVIDKLFLN